MAEPVPCPNCETPLLLPEGASVVACPNCGAELDVEPADAPEAAPAAKPAPLPFGRAARATPRGDDVTPVGKPVRGKYVPEPPSGELKAGVSAAEAEAAERRRREVEGRVRDLDREDRKAAKRYERISKECDAGRNAAQILAFTCVAEVVALILCAAFVALNLFGVGVGIVGVLAVVTRVVMLVMLGTGFGVALMGPTAARPMAALGLGLSVAALAAALAATLLVVRDTPEAGMVYTTDTDHFLLANLPFVNAMQGGTTLGDLAVYYALDGGPSGRTKIVCVLAALAWFAAVTALGTLTNHWAVGAKSPTLATRGLRFVTFLVSAIGFVTIGKALVMPFAPVDFRIVAVAGVVSVYFVMALLTWFGQFGTLWDLSDLIYPERWVDDRAEL